MKRLFILAATVPMFMLAACNKDNGSSPAENVQQAARDPSLQGKTFWSDCQLRPLTAIGTGILTGQSIKSSKTGLLFDGASVIRITQYFSAADCAGEYALTFKETGRFNILQDKKSSDSATFVDINYDILKLAADNAAGVQVANTLGLCGGSDWQAAQERDVTAHSADLKCYNTAVPRLDKNIYKLEGTTLFMGSQQPGFRDSDNRPTMLDRTNEKYVTAQ